MHRMQPTINMMKLKIRLQLILDFSDDLIHTSGSKNIQYRYRGQ